MVNNSLLKQLHRILSDNWQGHKIVFTVVISGYCSVLALTTNACVPNDKFATKFSKGNKGMGTPFISGPLGPKKLGNVT